MSKYTMLPFGTESAYQSAKRSEYGENIHVSAALMVELTDYAKGCEETNAKLTDALQKLLAHPENGQTRHECHALLAQLDGESK